MRARCCDRRARNPSARTRTLVLAIGEDRSSRQPQTPCAKGPPKAKFVSTECKLVVVFSLADSRFRRSMSRLSNHPDRYCRVSSVAEPPHHRPPQPRYRPATDRCQDETDPDGTRCPRPRQVPHRDFSWMVRIRALLWTAAAAGRRAVALPTIAVAPPNTRSAIRVGEPPAGQPAQKAYLAGGLLAHDGAKHGLPSEVRPRVVRVRTLAAKERFPQ